MNQDFYIACCHCCFYRSDGYCYKTNRNRKVMDAPCEWFFNGSIMDCVDSIASQVSKTAIACSMTYEDINRIADSYIEIISTPKPPTSDSNATFSDGASTPRQRTSEKPRCLSCDEELEIKVHGRNKYCGKCGCFLPECVYDQRFTDLVKQENPMKIIRPPALPTAKCRG